MSSPLITEDSHERQIAEAFANPTLLREVERIRQAHAQRIWKQVRKRLPADRLVQGREASELLSLAIQTVDEAIRKEAELLSPLHWLWLLRRAPTWMFEGPRRTSYGYDSLLAEVLTTSSPPVTHPTLKNGEVTFSVTGREVHALFRHCYATRVLSDLHSSYRLVSKGAPLRFDANDLPTTEPDDTLCESVDYFDGRADEHGGTSRVGTGALNYNLEREENRGSLLGVLQVEAQPLEFPAVFFGQRISQLYQASELTVPARFLPRFFDASDVQRNALATDYLAVLCGLALGTMIGLRHGSRLHSPITRGYYLLERGTLERYLDDTLAVPQLREAIAAQGTELDASRLLAELRSKRARSWPLLAGGFVRTSKQIACLDVSALTRRLFSLEGPQGGGRHVNQRAADFEHSTRQVIAGSVWKPSDEMLAFAGRTLRRGGKALTDIDAIACLDERLLLISCKSVMQTAEYDAGDHKTVRNAALRVAEAAQEWRKFVADLNARPTGDNFDFTRFRSVSGVVCTPAPVWTPLGIATEAADVANLPGLKTVVSLRELKRWLSR